MGLFNFGKPKQSHQKPAGFGQPVHPSQRGEDCNQITQNIWLGGYGALDANSLRARGISYVVNTAKELRTRTDLVDWNQIHAAGIQCLHTGWDDSMGQKFYPSRELTEAIQFVDRVVGSGGQVLINCAMGRSRSTSLVLSYMMIRMGVPFDQALAHVQSRRPIAQPNPNFMSQLREIEAAHLNSGGALSPHRGGAASPRMEAQPQPMAQPMGAYQPIQQTMQPAMVQQQPAMVPAQQPLQAAFTQQQFQPQMMTAAPQIAYPQQAAFPQVAQGFGSTGGLGLTATPYAQPVSPTMGSQTVVGWNQPAAAPLQSWQGQSVGQLW